MTTYQLHSQGPEVARIQIRLAQLGLYRGLIDADFGGGTLAAVKAFQAANGLNVDGQVGERTWAALFNNTQIVGPALLEQPLAYRCLALTGSFETGTAPPECFAGVAGDFDGQGLSFGALQWNLGQGTLQTLLQELCDTEPATVQRIFDTHYPELTAMLAEGLDEQLAWARSIQDPVRHRVYEPWQGFLKTLGREPECQTAEVKHAQQRYGEGMTWCDAYGVGSERAVALMFDINVQNGGISDAVRAQIERDVEVLDPALAADDLEVAKLRIIANRRADAATPRWIEDVRQRKLAIATGEGIVHGRLYNLEASTASGSRASTCRLVGAAGRHSSQVINNNGRSTRAAGL